MQESVHTMTLASMSDLSPLAIDARRDIEAVNQWIIAQAVERDDPLALLSGLIDRLNAIGIPVWHVGLGMATIDPMLRGISYLCWRDRPSQIEPVPHEALGDDPFQATPIYYALSHRLLTVRWNLQAKATDAEPPALASFRAQGATDYVLRLVMFPRPDMTDNGVALSFSTNRPGGFAADHVAAIDLLMPALALAGRTISIARTAHEALRVYLGSRTAQRVMSGQIRRGQGQTISAAIMIADLRGFTALSEREDPLTVVGWLDENLEVIGAAVEHFGGEVLKFLGDGLLAIFPFDGDAESPEVVCRKAIAAAEQALDQTVRLNAERLVQGAPVLQVGIALHAGEVVYGNIGAARRLDFTVIGSAVNEAARMEALCAVLERNLLLSDAFSARCGRATTSLGLFDLRGLVGKRDIRVLQDQSAAL